MALLALSLKKIAVFVACISTIGLGISTIVKDKAVSGAKSQKADRWDKAKKLIDKVKEIEEDATNKHLERLQTLGEFETAIAYPQVKMLVINVPFSNGLTAGEWLIAKGFKETVIVKSAIALEDEAFRKFVDKNNPKADAEKLVMLCVKWAITNPVYLKEIRKWINDGEPAGAYLEKTSARVLESLRE